MLTLTRSGLTLNLNASVVPATGSSNVPILYMEEISDDYTGYLIEPRIGFTQSGKYTEFIGTYEEESQSVIIPAQCFTSTGSVDITIALIDPEDPDHVEVCTPKKFSVTKAPMGTVVLPEEPTWQDYVLNYMKQNLDKLQGPQGAKGDPGDNATINVGEVTTLDPGQQATVTNTGSETNAVLAFGIPKGEKDDKGDKGDTGPQGIQGPKGDTGATGPQGPQGEKGPQGLQGIKGDTGEQGPKGGKGDVGDNAAIAIGTVTTLEPDQEATVSNTGTETNAVLSFGIPKGVQGDVGPQGPQGAPGTNENVPHADISKAENPSVSDSYEAPLQDLKLYGKSTQESTSGKNLFDADSITQVGNNYAFDISKLVIDETYTISCDADLFSFKISNTISKNTSIGANNVVTGKSTFTMARNANIPEDTTQYLFITQTSTVTANDITTADQAKSLHIQIEKGSTATAYEPYTGGQPSPSPDYPQEITCIEEVDCLVTGAQLLDLSNTEDGIETTYELTDTGLTVTGKYYVSCRVNVDPNSDVYISYEKTASGVNSIVIFDETTSITSEHKIETIPLSGGTFNVGDRNSIRVLFYSGYGSPNSSTYNNVMLCKGTSALPYEPYQSQHVQFTPPAPLYSLLDGSVADYVDVARGKYVYRLANTMFDGSEDELWGEYNNEDLGYDGVLIQRPDMKVAMRQSGFCDKLIIEKGISFPSTTGAWLGVNNNYIYLPYANTFAGTTNATEFRTWLATNNLHFVYPLATATEQDIPVETLEALQALKTFNGVTNIFCNAPVSAQYEQSVQILINRILEQLNSLQTQTLSLQEEMVNNV